MEDLDGDKSEEILFRFDLSLSILYLLLSAIILLYGPTEKM
jgi:hypothetical protein